MIITAADLNTGHIGAQITITHPRTGVVYTGEFVSVTPDTLINDARLRVELIIGCYQAMFVLPDTAVTVG